jgi:hypothetical protein
MRLPFLELQTQVEVAAVLLVLLLAQAVQASSSSNTPHLFKLHSHSKVLASGLHLLA